MPALRHCLPLFFLLSTAASGQTSQANPLPETPSAQTTEAAIAARLTGHPIFLRGLWTCGHLSFHPDGQIAKDCRHGELTQAGFLVDSVKLNGEGLRLDGRRELFEFDDKGHLRPLRAASHIRIDIEGHPGQDYAPALAAAVAVDLGDLAPSLPDYWQRWAFLSAGRPAPQYGTKPIASPRVAADPGRVSRPKLLHMAEPEYSEEARQAKISGDVQVYLVVDKEGLPQHVSIVRPFGHGLDRKAIEAVSQYRFSPAMRDGEPVAVDLYVNVNFQIF